MTSTAPAADDGDVDALAVLAHGDVVRVMRQRDVLRDLQRLRVGDVERRLGLVRDVEAAAVRCHCRAVVHLDAGNLAHHLVGVGIDQHDAVAGGVGLDDPDRGRLQREGGQRQSAGQNKGSDERFGLHSHSL